MRTADVNRNGELSYTELTTMLGGSVYAEFGRWINSLKQQGFREYDTDAQGSIDLGELTESCLDFLDLEEYFESSEEMLVAAEKGKKPKLSTSVLRAHERLEKTIEDNWMMAQEGELEDPEPRLKSSRLSEDDFDTGDVGSTVVSGERDRGKHPRLGSGYVNIEVHEELQADHDQLKREHERLKMMYAKVHNRQEEIEEDYADLKHNIYEISKQFEFTTERASLQKLLRECFDEAVKNRNVAT